MALRPPQFTAPKEKPGFMDYLKQSLAGGVGQGVGAAIAAPIKDLSRQYIIERPKLEQQQSQFESQLAATAAEQSAKAAALKEQQLFVAKQGVLRTMVEKLLVPAQTLGIEQKAAQAGDLGVEVKTRTLTDAESSKQLADNQRALRGSIAEIDKRLRDGGVTGREREDIANEKAALEVKLARTRKHIKANKRQSETTSTRKIVTDADRLRVQELNAQRAILIKKYKTDTMEAIVKMAEILFPGEGERRITSGLKAYQLAMEEKQKSAYALRLEQGATGTQAPTPAKPAKPKPRSKQPPVKVKRSAVPTEEVGTAGGLQKTLEKGLQPRLGLDPLFKAGREAARGYEKIAPESARSSARSAYSENAFKEVRKEMQGLGAPGAHLESLNKTIKSFNDLLSRQGQSDKVQQLKEQVKALTLTAASQGSGKAEETIENLNRIVKALDVGKEATINEVLGKDALDALKEAKQLSTFKDLLSQMVKLSKPQEVPAWAKSQNSTGEKLADLTYNALAASDAADLNKLQKRYGMRDSDLVGDVVITFLSRHSSVLVDAAKNNTSLSSIYGQLKEVIRNMAKDIR